jgi:hypothetical protein
MNDESEITTHGEYREYVARYFGQTQSTNAYRILSFLAFGNKNAIEHVSGNPHTRLTAYFSVPSTKRFVGIITGIDKITLLADSDIMDKFVKEFGTRVAVGFDGGEDGYKNLQTTNFTWNRGAMIIPTDPDSGFVDDEGNLIIDMEFVTNFGKFCLADDAPPYGKLDSTSTEG